MKTIAAALLIALSCCVSAQDAAVPVELNIQLQQDIRMVMDAEQKELQRELLQQVKDSLSTPLSLDKDERILLIPAHYEKLVQVVPEAQ